jgi:hypothetical protein
VTLGRRRLPVRRPRVLRADGRCRAGSWRRAVGLLGSGKAYEVGCPATRDCETLLWAGLADLGIGGLDERGMKDLGRE